MPSAQGRFFRNGSRVCAAVVSGAFLLVFNGACRGAATAPPPLPSNPIVTIGVGQIQVDEFIKNYTLESLARVGLDGQMVPRLAEQLIVSPDRLSLTVVLRNGVTFHDGSPVSADLIADVLTKRLKTTLGADDVLGVSALPDGNILVRFTRPSSFAFEALEATIAKPDAPSIGTGPFAATGESGKLRANQSYYLGPPATEGLQIKMFPSLRTSWAEFLRGGLDVIYEVGRDARDLLSSSAAVNTFPFTRPYQYVVLLNSKTPAGRSPAVRRALNSAIDRSAFVRDALGGHGQPSAGPVWPRHWSARSDWPTFSYDPESAAETLMSHGQRIHLKCLVTPGDERVALVVKRQLQAVGVDVTFEELSVPDFTSAFRSGEFDAALAAAASGPSLLRPYEWWHSKGPRNFSGYSNATVDAAFDAIRHAPNDDEYRQAVDSFQRSILEDPPAIFLAWDEVARLASRRLDIQAENGTDMMGTLRLWRIGNPGVAAN